MKRSGYGKKIYRKEVTSKVVEVGTRRITTGIQI